MKTVVVAQSKGGVGKSTLTFLLAMSLDNAAVPVAVRDLDPQGSLALWIGHHKDTLPNVELLDPRRSKPTRPTGILLVDSEGRTQFEAVLPNLPQADLYIVPVTPGTEDIRIAAKTVTLLRKNRPTCEIRLLWNRIRSGLDTSDPKLLAEYTKAIGAPCFRNRVHDSKPYADASSPAPRGGWSRACRSRHALELRSLATELSTTLIG